MKVRTVDEVREELRSKGVSLTQWAVANEVSPQLVYEIMAGRRKCIRGQSHIIAVKLGLKAGEICTSPARALEPTRRRQTSATAAA